MSAIHPRIRLAPLAVSPALSIEGRSSFFALAMCLIPLDIEMAYALEAPTRRAIRIYDATSDSSECVLPRRHGEAPTIQHPADCIRRFRDRPHPISRRSRPIMDPRPHSSACRYSLDSGRQGTQIPELRPRNHSRYGTEPCTRAPWNLRRPHPATRSTRASRTSRRYMDNRRYRRVDPTPRNRAPRASRQRSRQKPLRHPISLPGNRAAHSQSAWQGVLASGELAPLPQATTRKMASPNRCCPPFIIAPPYAPEIVDAPS